MSNLEATSVIKEALNGFIINFPKTRVRYEFDINANVHCIEIVPNHIYHLENDYSDIVGSVMTYNGIRETEKLLMKTLSLFFVLIDSYFSI